MTSSRSAFVASLLLLSVSPAISAPQFDLDLESGAVWNSKADVRIPNTGGTFFSLPKDLGADDPRAFFRGRLTWHPSPNHDFSLLYAPLEMDFRGQFNRAVRFAGTDFAPRVVSTGVFRFDSYRLTYRDFYQRSLLFGAPIKVIFWLLATFSGCKRFSWEFLALSGTE